MTDAGTDDRQLDAARIAVERARARLMGSAHELQDRMNPKTLVRGAWEGAKDKGADLAEDAVDAVRSRPYAAGGAVAALTLFLARAPIIALAGRLFGAKKRPTKRRPRSNTKSETAS